MMRLLCSIWLLCCGVAWGHLPQASHTPYYHADGAGNVTTLMDAQEGIAARYLYNPFGRLTGECGPMSEVNRYRFSSKEVHAASGLSYYGFRFYDAGLQRWLNPDPLGEAGGINLFGFVSNDPLSFVDPYGESDENRPPVVVFPPNIGQAPFYGPPALEPNIRQGVPNPLDLLEAIAADQHQGNLAIADLLLNSPLGGLFRWPGDSDEEARDSLADAIDKALATMGNSKCMPKTGAGLAAKTLPTPQYYIQEGVRRSVAAREAGLTKIPATIFVEGQAPVTTTLPINQLFSPKAEIPLNSRFLNIQPPIRVPITVEPLGLPGQMPTTPLPNVKLVP